MCRECDKTRGKVGKIGKISDSKSALKASEGHNGGWCSDVIHPQTTREDILQQYQNEKFVNRKLTTLLLDQGFISGIGNYLRSEILFYSVVHPSYKLKDCSKDQVDKLAFSTFKLSRRSYETGGITYDPDIVEALKREGASRKEFRHFVYNRTGNFCHKCGTQIEEEKTGGRKVYYCPSCQSK